MRRVPVGNSAAWASSVVSEEAGSRSSDPRAFSRRATSLARRSLSELAVGIGVGVAVGIGVAVGAALGGGGAGISTPPREAGAPALTVGVVVRGFTDA